MSQLSSHSAKPERWSKYFVELRTDFPELTLLKPWGMFTSSVRNKIIVEVCRDLEVMAEVFGTFLKKYQGYYALPHTW